MRLVIVRARTGCAHSAPIRRCSRKLGLVNIDLQPKPALAVWDSAYARPCRR